MLLENGAKHVTTLEFGRIESQHPQIDTYIPTEFTLNFLQGNIKQFDFAFSYSSIEHDGLGRYGDIINPDGDLEIMSKLLTIVKPGGHVMIGVPCCYDRLDWNAHRIYRPLRLPLLFSGYRILGLYPPKSQMGNTKVGYMNQPVWVLQNSWGCCQKRSTINFTNSLRVFSEKLGILHFSARKLLRKMVVYLSSPRSLLNFRLLEIATNSLRVLLREVFLSFAAVVFPWARTTKESDFCQ